jgi:acyl-coenzyme A thioesterase PaaI-like protein
MFVGAVKPGEFLECDAEVVRITRSLVFIRGIVRVGDRQVLAADGVWKILGAN